MSYSSRVSNIISGDADDFLGGFGSSKVTKPSQKKPSEDHNDLGSFGRFSKLAESSNTKNKLQDRLTNIGTAKTEDEKLKKKALDKTIEKAKESRKLNSNNRPIDKPMSKPSNERRPGELKKMTYSPIKDDDHYVPIKKKADSYNPLDINSNRHKPPKEDHLPNKQDKLKMTIATSNSKPQKPPMSQPQKRTVDNTNKVSKPPEEKRKMRYSPEPGDITNEIDSIRNKAPLLKKNDSFNTKEDKYDPKNVAKTLGEDQRKLNQQKEIEREKGGMKTMSSFRNTGPSKKAMMVSPNKTFNNKMPMYSNPNRPREDHNNNSFKRPNNPNMRPPDRGYDPLSKRPMPQGHPNSRPPTQDNDKLRKLQAAFEPNRRPPHPSQPQKMLKTDRHEPLPPKPQKQSQAKCEPAPKQKKIPDSQNPDFIYCMRCGKRHHKDLHNKQAPINQAPQNRPSNNRPNNQMSNRMGGNKEHFNPFQGKRDRLDPYANEDDYSDDYNGGYEEDDDFDYDDGFIDDSYIDDYAEKVDYKKELKKVTGYDPSKFDPMKELGDDRLMEVRDFDVQQKEEYISRKKGREDDEKEEMLLAYKARKGELD